MDDRHEQPSLTYDTHRRSGSSGGYSRRSGGHHSGKHSSRRHHRGRRRNRLTPRFVVLLAVLLALLIGISIGIRCCAKPTLRGRWDLDGTTVYKFDRNGEGALVLMYTEYDFTYTVEGDQLYIDFTDDAALDARYTFQVDGRMLFLTGGPGDARSEYVLTRII